MRSYLLDLRKLVGHRKLIHPAARIILENECGDILLVRRSDNDQWGLIAGGLEEAEDIQACIRREVREETGLLISSLTAIGLSTRPEVETTQYPNGDIVQYFTVVFYTNAWQGQLLQKTSETTEARFFPRQTLPPLPPNEAPALAWLTSYQQNGQFIIA
jgi:8-oxo-dGTP pyrophosphatase MutT (NUDIX family)